MLTPLLGWTEEDDYELLHMSGKKFTLPLDGPVPSDELQILGAYLTQYKVPVGEMSPNGVRRAVYDILSFATDKNIRKRKIDRACPV